MQSPFIKNAVKYGLLLGFIGDQLPVFDKVVQAGTHGHDHDAPQESVPQVTEFHGFVYVAQDAQRTDAQQQNRNIQLDNSHIVALPQLEIYADDVRCSHGSTVGYSDAEAIFYMRQRGISEADARRLQIEGFVQDVVSRCHMEPVCAFVHDAVADKLSKI